MDHGPRSWDLLNLISVLSLEIQWQWSGRQATVAPVHKQYNYSCLLQRLSSPSPLPLTQHNLVLLMLLIVETRIELRTFVYNSI